MLTGDLRLGVCSTASEIRARFGSIPRKVHPVYSLQETGRNRLQLQDETFHRSRGIASEGSVEPSETKSGPTDLGHEEKWHEQTNKHLCVAAPSELAVSMVLSTASELDGPTSHPTILSTLSCTLLSAERSDPFP
jgi:hypothetical protein